MSILSIHDFGVFSGKRVVKEKFGYRIHFKKLSGEGPDEGWLSCYISGYQVAKCKDPVEWHQLKVVPPQESLGAKGSL